MQPEPLTMANIAYGMSVVGTWLDIRKKAGMEVTSTNIASITKSCLLTRLLTGKEPLPDPPPTSFSAPWYELIEDGGAYIDPGFDIYFAQDGAVIIRQCADWRILRGKPGDAQIFLYRIHRWHGSPMSEQWVLKQRPDQPLLSLMRLPKDEYVE